MIEGYYLTFPVLQIALFMAVSTARAGLIVSDGHGDLEAIRKAVLP